MPPNRLVPVLLAIVVALTACGSEEPRTSDTLPDAGGLRAPTPIEVANGAVPPGIPSRVPEATAESSGAVTTDAMTMLAPVELVLGAVGELPTATTGYVFPAGATVSAETVGALAAALGVEGEAAAGSTETGTAWQVGTTDGTAPSLTVGADATLSWWYSAAWGEPVEAPACAPVTTIPENSGALPDTVVPCPAPTPPAGVPTAAEAEERARQLVAELGVDLDAVQFEVHADEWFASVDVTQVLDGVRSPMRWSFGFGPEGVLQHANGMLASPEPVGPYPLLDLDTAFARLQEQQTGTWGGGFARDVLTAQAVPSPEMTPTTMARTVDAGTVAAPAPDTPVLTVIEPAEPPATYPPETVPPIVVTLVDVEADLWWVGDVDGSVWLLPAYRFIGDDGGWYTVPAVTDEYLLVVEPEPVIPPDSVPPPPLPMPSLPPTSVPVSATDLPGVIDVAALEPFVGLTLEEFTIAVEEVGGTVRVVEEDGVELVITDDYRTDRVNVAVEGGAVTRIIDAG